MLWYFVCYLYFTGMAKKKKKAQTVWAAPLLFINYCVKTAKRTSKQTKVSNKLKYTLTESDLVWLRKRHTENAVGGCYYILRCNQCSTTFEMKRSRSFLFYLKLCLPRPRVWNGCFTSDDPGHVTCTTRQISKRWRICAKWKCLNWSDLLCSKGLVSDKRETYM